MENLVTWFDIPVADIERAVAFYNEIFGWDLQIIQGGPSNQHRLAFIPHPENRTGGCLAEGEGYAPSTHGAIPYLYAGRDVNDILRRVEAAGGKIVLDKMSMGEHGSIARILDTERNYIGLHSEG